MGKRQLLRLGYRIKHTSAGWWVEGRCGYSVTSYHATESDAVISASERIKAEKAAGNRPIWMFGA